MLNIFYSMTRGQHYKYFAKYRKTLFYSIIIVIILIIFLTSYLILTKNNQNSNDDNDNTTIINNTKTEALSIIGHELKEIIINEHNNTLDDIILAPDLTDNSTYIIDIKTDNISDIINNDTNNIKKEIYMDNNEFNERLKTILKCNNRDYRSEVLLNGNFWILKNYIRAEHGELGCHETITYTTHGDYTFLYHLVPLLNRWHGPISIALHAPGTDFMPTLDSIFYLRNCLPESIAIRQFVTFHLYFSTKHIPNTIPTKIDQHLEKVNCNVEPAPYILTTKSYLYTTSKNLLYPINIGRNIARSAALTHFVLASDIEFYPNRNLIPKFLKMIALNKGNLQRNYSRVYTLPLFQINNSELLIKGVKNKKQLLKILDINVVPYRSRMEPKLQKWIKTNYTTDYDIFHVAKRLADFKKWDPIYIGTNADPLYDERLRWEGKNDRSTQSYALCLLNYEFFILNNAFLIVAIGDLYHRHKTHEDRLEGITNQLIFNINTEMRNVYGKRAECDL